MKLYPIEQELTPDTTDSIEEIQENNSQEENQDHEHRKTNDQDQLKEGSEKEIPMTKLQL